MSRSRAIEVLAAVRGHLDAVEARLLARAIEDGATDLQVDSLSKQSGSCRSTPNTSASRPNG